MKFQLKIETSTWDKDNYDLFDYESVNISRSLIETEKEGFLSRKDIQIHYSKIQDVSENHQKLLNIQQDQGDLFIDPKGCLPLWIVNRGPSAAQLGQHHSQKKLNEQQQNQQQVNEGSVFRLGKKQFTIKKIKDPDQHQNLLQSYNIKPNHIPISLDLKKISNLADTFLSQQELEDQEDLDDQNCLDDQDDLDDQDYQDDPKVNRILSDGLEDQNDQLQTESDTKSPTTRQSTDEKPPKQLSARPKRNPKIQKITDEERDGQQCRICLRHSTCKANPLISPCSCKGSIRRIHIVCLRHWINSKLILRQTDTVVEFNQKAVKCELCKEYFPPQVRVNDDIFDLYGFASNFRRYVILEDRDGPLYLLNFTHKSELSVGRGHNSDFKIGEITVSRNHSSFTLQNGKLYLKDKSSKFGTLVLLQNPFRIPVNRDLVLQSGRTLIVIKRKNITSFFDSIFGFCCGNSTYDKNIQNEGKQTTQKILINQTNHLNQQHSHPQHYSQSQILSQPQQDPGYQEI